MAMISYGAGIEQYSGKYGSAIFYRDGCSYHVITAPPHPRQTLTPARARVRNAFRQSVRIWNTQIALDPIRRPRIEQYADLDWIYNRKGERFHPTGYQYFLGIAISYIIYGALALLKAWILAGCPPL